jgi:hypothetical protein
VNEVRIAIRQSTGQDASDLLPSTSTSHQHRALPPPPLPTVPIEEIEETPPPIPSCPPPLPSMPPPSVPLPPRPRPRQSIKPKEEEEEGQEIQDINAEEIPEPTYAPPPLPKSSSNPFDD